MPTNATAPAFLCLASALCLSLLLGCGSEGTTCDDLVEGATYTEVSSLFMHAGPKGCVQCHNTREPVHGLDFAGPGVTYDALTTRYEAIYEQVASGSMPQDGVRWSEQDLRKFRTWYCQGSIYESP